MNNVYEILKKYQNHVMGLYSPAFGSIPFFDLRTFDKTIFSYDNEGFERIFDEYGRLSKNGECMLYPDMHLSWEKFINNVRELEDNIISVRDSETITKSGKIKPKFNVGDWIRPKNTNTSFSEITEVSEERYIFDNDSRDFIRIENQEGYELWNINLAKPGDILYRKSIYSDLNWVYIFNKINSSSNAIVYDALIDYDYSNSLTYGPSSGIGYANEPGQYIDRPARYEEAKKLIELIKDKGYYYDKKSCQLVQMSNLRKLVYDADEEIKSKVNLEDREKHIIGPIFRCLESIAKKVDELDALNYR